LFVTLLTRQSGIINLRESGKSFSDKTSVSDFVSSVANQAQACDEIKIFLWIIQILKEWKSRKRSNSFNKHFVSNEEGFLLDK
jgi:hypothetical protein